jgi:hypothetical protein
VGTSIEEVVVVIWVTIILEEGIIIAEVALDNKEVNSKDRVTIKLSNASFLNKVSINF